MSEETAGAEAGSEGNGAAIDPPAIALVRRSDLLNLPCLVICLGCALAPIASFAIPPLVDYPAHLARQFIIHDLLTAKKFFDMYHLHFAVIPNLAMEIIVLPLLFVGIPLEIAGRLFLSLVVALLGGGVILVQRALFGRASPLSLLGFGYIYNPVFMYGFVNYVLGVALALVGFSWWLRVRDKPSPVILLCALLWCTTLFFCHLTAVLLFLGLIGAYELSLSLAAKPGSHRFAGLIRATKIFGAPAAAVVLLYCLGPFGSEPSSSMPSFRDVLLGIPQRVRALPSYFGAYSYHTDFVSLVCVLFLVAGGLWLDRIRLAVPMILAIVGLTLIYLVVPDEWSGTQGVAYRLPLAIFFLLLSSVNIGPDRYALVSVLVTILIVFRTSAVMAAWAGADTAYTPMMSALEKLPAGSTLVTGVNYRSSFEPQLRQPWSHFASYAAIRRKVFAVDVFADPTQNWIVPTSVYGDLFGYRLRNNRTDTNRVPLQGHDMFNSSVISRFDYLLAVRPDLYQGKIPDGLKEEARSAGTVLYSLHP